MLITTYNNTTFARKSTITRYMSMITNKRMYDIGSFELTTNECDFELGDIILYDDFCGMVYRIIKSFSGVKVYGYDLKALFYQRYIDTDITYTNKTAEFILKDMATKFLETGDRTVSGLSVTADSGSGEKIDTYTFKRGSRVSDLLKTFCQTYNIGYDITFDETTMIFNVIKEHDNTEVVFSRERHNVEDLEYTKGRYDLANVIYYLDENEVLQSDGTAKGIKRFEGYTEKADEVEKYKTEHAEEETLRGSANLEYGVDYKLGDVVTVMYDEMTTTKTITEVEKAEELSKRIITPTFGTEKENPIKKLLKG